LWVILLHAGAASNSNLSDDKKKGRKNPKPRHLSSYGKPNNTSPVQPSETETKSEGKRVCFKTDADVRQMKQNTSSSRENQLIIKETVMENLPTVTTQFRSDQINDRQVKPEKSKKNAESYCLGFEQCVKIIRQLECSGNVESSFRQKFLTWFSLRATAQEINTVKTFIHAFKDDSTALAEQLVDTFSDCIWRKGPAIGDGDGGGSNGISCKKPRH
ncbi:VIN3-like protein 2, partial [Arabidopsis lyrata subsp. lyrata]|uniref:VIN3-like protein 2 n=1 Tax=Arabidopsis lyrata subsp. lyrata TaxID=81972 RepID=UPI000A29A5F4